MDELMKFIVKYKDMSEIVQYELEQFSQLPKKAQELILTTAYIKSDPFYFSDSVNIALSSKSPIEIIFAIAFNLIWLVYENDVLYPQKKQSTIACLESQYEILSPSGKRYIADFAYVDESKNIRIIIECDGHEFHQKTKQQVEKDNNRTFELQSMGYTVFRFSGSQIYKDSLGCAYKIFSYLLGLYEVNADA